MGRKDKNKPLTDDSVITVILDGATENDTDSDDGQTVLIRPPADFGGDDGQTVLIRPSADFDGDDGQTVLIRPSADFGGDDGVTQLLGRTSQSASVPDAPMIGAGSFDELDFSGICLNCFKSMDGSNICPHCGWTVGAIPAQAYHLHPGSRLDNRYIIGTVVGFGGFGTTYRAWDAVLGVVVAVKEFFPAGLVSRIPGDMKVAFFSGEKKTQYHDQLNRYLDEARNLAKFSECPYIVRVLRYFEANNTAYIVMEYLEGITLKDYARNADLSQKALEPEDAIRILEPMTHALELIHKSGIIHRDISPDNIFITSDEQIKLLDFGAARLSKNVKDVTNMAVIKPGYAPPEQYRTKSEQGPYTDMYGLGATLYRILTGVVPVESVDRASGEDPLEKPSQLGVKINPNLEKAVMTAMAVDPNLRFKSMKDFRDAILDKINVDLPEVTRKKRQRRRLAALIASVFMLAVSGAAFWLYMEYRPLPLSEIMPDPDTISVLVPSGSDTNYNSAVMQDLSERFTEMYNGVSIEFVSVDIESYEPKLQVSFAANDMPALYFTENISGAIADAALPLDDVIKSLNMESYPLFARYGDIYPSKKAIPLSCEISMVYANQNALEYNQTILPEEIASLDALREGVRWDILDGCYDSYFSLYGGARPGNLDENKASAALDALLEARRPQDPESAGRTVMERFQNDELSYLFASTKHLQEISRSMAGLYKPVPVFADSACYGVFHDTWAVSAQATRNQRNIAKLFLIYMLSDYAQERLYIENTSWIPVNSEAFSAYLSVFSELSFLSGHLSGAEFRGEYSQAGRIVGGQFEEKIKNPDDLSPEALRGELWDILLKYKD